MIGAGVMKLALGSRGCQPIAALLLPGPASSTPSPSVVWIKYPSHANNHIVTSCLSLCVLFLARSDGPQWRGAGRQSLFPILQSIESLNRLPCLSNCRSRGLCAHHSVEPVKHFPSSASTFADRWVSASSIDRAEY